MYTLKKIRISIQLQSGEFEDGSNVVTIEGLPISVEIQKQGGEERNSATVTISGLKLATITKLTRLSFKRLETYNNILQVEAGDDGAALHNIFMGEITLSHPEMDSEGNMDLKIEATAASYSAQIAAPPVSVSGETPVENLFKQFAEDAKYKYENKGVSGSVKNCVFLGSPVHKAKTLARQIGCDLLINDGKFITQPFEAPKDGEIPLINKDSGLIGYPAYGTDGIECSCLFNPALDIGKWFKLESILPAATGEWQIAKLEHRLEVNRKGGGMWQTSVLGVQPE